MEMNRTGLYLITRYFKTNAELALEPEVYMAWTQATDHNL